MRFITSTLIASALSVGLQATAKEPVVFTTDYPVKEVSTATTCKVQKKADNQKTVITAPEGTATTYTRYAEGFMLTNQGVAAQQSTKGTLVVEGTDGYTYIQNPVSTTITNSYVKGKREGDRLNLTLPQPVLEETVDGMEECYYLMKMVLFEPQPGQYTYIPAEVQEASYVYDGSNFTLEIENTNAGTKLPPSAILGLATLNEDWIGFGDYVQQYTPFTETPHEAPENLVTENWSFSYKGSGRPVEMGFDNGDVWVKGICPTLPGAWVKGTITDDGSSIAFESSQYLGIDPATSYHLYFMCAHIELLFNEDYQDYLYTPVLDKEIKMAYDPEKGTLSSAEGSCILINGKKDRLFVVEQFENPGFKKLGAMTEFTPATPTLVEFVYEKLFGVSCFGFNLPSVNKDGQQLDTSNMSYSIYVNGELFTFSKADYMLSSDLTELPYNLTNHSMDIYAEGELHYIYIYDKFDTIGVKSCYKSGDETFWSDILEYDVLSGTTTGVENNTIGQPEAVSETYHTLQGIRTDNPSNGIFIRTTTYSDGKVRSTKIRR